MLDACLTADPYSKVACETATKDNMVMVFGEITTGAKLDYDKIVRGEVKKIGDLSAKSRWQKAGGSVMDKLRLKKSALARPGV